MSPFPEINWLTRNIFIPQDYEGYTVLQTTPSLILGLDTNRLRNDLRTLEASEAGAIYEDTHTHNTQVTVSGLTLERVIQILSPYTITFEDGAYRVILQGSNNNILDVATVNQVSIAPSNSAGLSTSQAIEFNEYSEAVTIDQTLTTNTTLYPAGTRRQPVGNIPDAITIAEARGFGDIKVLGNLSLGAGDDVRGYRLLGQNAARSQINVGSLAETENIEVLECFLTGDLDGLTIIRRCSLQNVRRLNGFLFQCSLQPGLFDLLGAGRQVDILQCYSGQPGTGAPILDANGATNIEDVDISVRQYSGGLQLRGLDSGAACSFDFVSGQLKVEMDSCTNGTIVARGNAKVVDAATGEYLPSGTYNGNLTILNETIYVVWEIWRRLGLDPSAPLITNPDGTITVGTGVNAINITATRDGGGTITATRQ